MRNSIVFLTLIVSLAYFHISQAKPDQQVLDLLNTEINAAETSSAKARFLMFRARWYINSQDLDTALLNYNQALALTDKPWIRMERSRLYLKLKQYQQARDDARIARNSLPSLLKRSRYRD